MPQARSVLKSARPADSVRAPKVKRVPVRLADDAVELSAVASPSLALQQRVANSLNGAALAAPATATLSPLQKLAIVAGLTTGLWAMIATAVYWVIGFGVIA